MKNQKSSTPKAMKVSHTSEQLSALIQNIWIQLGYNIFVISSHFTRLFHQHETYLSSL